MSILTHSPAIVRDGLVLCLDAGAVRSYPGNLVTNGAFDADSDWTKGTNWTIGSGAASHTAGSASYLTQAVGKLVEGKSYVCTYTISSYSAGDVRLVLGGTNGTYRGVTGGAQTWRETLTCGSTDSNVKFYGHTAFVGSIDNVIVQEATWSDLSGNLNNGTLVNEPVFSAESGAGGTRSFDFDGSSDKVTFGDIALNLSTGATMAFWCEHVDNSNGAVLGSDDSGYHSYIQPHSNGTIYFESSDDSNTATGAMSGTDGFHHYVVSVTGYTATIYEDGVDITTDSSLSSANVTFNYIGTTGAKWFNGKVAIVHMYNRALTAAEIQQNYRTHKGRFGL